MSTTVWVYTMNRSGEVGAWSRYVFPFRVDNFCQLGDDLYIRAGDHVLMVDPSSTMDYKGHPNARPFDGVIQWPWLDFGQPGLSKQLLGVDISAMNASGIEIEVGYDQTNKSAFTTPYMLPGDSVPGTFTPLPVLAPSFSIRLRLSSYDFWQFQAVTLYLNDQAMTA